ncbi:MAG: asparagine synthase (glutamine-hydrolyzing) [Planctomycetes bacterium]|nr:asparagine synthase (glutamine-hydrolyzing) [Planctomycetota bacterium]
MCGIAGILHRDGSVPDGAALRRMTAALTHRGPDDSGHLVLPGIALGHRRLSIIDLSPAGRQPLANEDETVWTVFNGEIFDYLELRERLEGLGHRFRTHTDTEVIVHGYEEWGDAFVERLNGQFAIALWDSRRRRLLLARDRLGIRPLFHARLGDGTLLFASEVKALFEHGGLSRRIDPVGVGQVFSLWVNVPPRTVFAGVSEVPPGHRLATDARGQRIDRYWRLSFPAARDYEDRPLADWTEGTRELLHDATRLQLRADVPVGSYLSGGLDSSAIAALVKRHHDPGLVTWSVAFRDPAYDEREHQQRMVEHLRTDHHTLEIDAADIAAAFPEVVRLAERPLLRTAPAPMLLLAQGVQRSGMKVVLTGEGADEIFAGYNIFREDKVRRFWARSPGSKSRPLLLSRLYAYIARSPSAQAFWQAFFKTGLEAVDDPYYSHLLRWTNTAWIQRLFHPEFAAATGSFEDVRAELDAWRDPELMSWHPLCRAQYLELGLFMPGYLLASQGDRMMMGRGVEGRFPFLDHRLVEFAARIPPRHKLRGLAEKFVLKQACEELVPRAIRERQKQPYRAPIGASLLAADSPAAAMLAPDAVKRYGYFEPGAVARLVEKLRSHPSGAGSAREDMAIAGIVSLHLLHEQLRLDPR